MKVVPRGKFIALSDSIKLLERSHTSDLTEDLKALKQKEEIIPKSSQQEIIQLRDEINKIETIKIMQRINDAKSWFFEVINTIYRSLAQLTKRRVPHEYIQK